MLPTFTVGGSHGILSVYAITGEMSSPMIANRVAGPDAKAAATTISLDSTWLNGLALTPARY